MKFIVKIFPEVALKSKTVKKHFTKILANNIRTTLKPIDETVTVVNHWDFLAVNSKDPTKRDVLLEKLVCICGIHHILEVDEMPFTDLHDIFTKTLERVKDDLIDKTFCVRVKRRGKHSFSSMDVMQYVGGGLNQHIDSAKVKLKNPDVTVKIEIDNDKMLFIKERFEGLGGFPMGTQEDVLSLISGGFDSGVASFEFIRRGSRVHYLFFNMGGSVHELGVKQMAYQLWQKYSLSHKVKFISVNFEPVVAEILTKIDDGQMGVVLKRMMMRVASRIAKDYRIEALVTGEAMGQVASQTLTNLAMIDKVSDTLILRPLITHDKQHIMAVAERIGTADIAKAMPEFCGVISKSPTVKANENKLNTTEANFDWTVLDKAVESAICTDIRTLDADTNKSAPNITKTHHLKDNDIVIDIRTDDEIEQNPLHLPNNQVMHIPFYRLATAFSSLDKNQNYLLYCTKGVMSKLQAVHLIDKGFKVGIYSAF